MGEQVPVDVDRAGRRAPARRATRVAVVGSGAVLAAGVAGPGLVLGASPVGAASTFTVSNLDDAGAGSLRQAIEDANAAAGDDVITFQSGLSGSIVLSSDLPKVTEAVDIQGPGADVLTVDGNNKAILWFDSISSGTVAVSGLTLTNGLSEGDGGAIRVRLSDVDVAVDDVAVVNNEANSDGGGISVNGAGSVTIVDSVISGNVSANGAGGGLYFKAAPGAGATLTVIDSEVTGNNGVDGGGGFDVLYADTLIAYTTVADNSADGGGGIRFYGTADQGLTIHSSTISGNASSDFGGGLYNHSVGAVFIANSTISGNTAGQAGAIYGTAGGLTLVQSTVTANTATGEGNVIPPLVGGIQLSESRSGDSGAAVVADPGSALLVGSIVAGNSGQDLGIYDEEAVSASSDHSVVGTVDEDLVVTDLGGSQFDVTDPGLAPLADNGGPTETHALVAGSPAIDAGPDPVPDFPGASFDQRGEGFARVVNGTVDVGAFEIQGDVPPGPDPDVVVPVFTG